MKEILIINGSGGVGKDTFVDCLSSLTSVYHTSIVNPVKSIAKEIGWSGDKEEKDRKFLSDLKVIIDEYNDNNYKQMAEIMASFKNNKISEEILCIDMREPSQIERAKKEFGAKTVLVTRDSVPQIVSNLADACVYDFDYDYHIDNNGSKEDLLKRAKSLLSELRAPHYEKVVYISHPFHGDCDNMKDIESIVLKLIKLYPTYLFISPVHAFGFEYNSIEYRQGLAECLWLLRKSDEMWVYGDYERSEGCQTEIEFCKLNDIPYYFNNAETKEY